MSILVPSFLGLLGAPTETERARILAVMPAGPFTSKRTRSNRLADLDDAIVSVVEKMQAGEIRVHDMAASDGITSLELFNRLQAVRPVRLRSSDYYDSISMAKRGPAYIFYDQDGSVLQVALGRIALRSKRSNRTLARLLSPDMTKMVRIPLLHPRAIAKSRADDRFTLARDSFFDPAPGQYELVRVMNALGERNFQREDIERAIRAIAPTVAIGGLLILGRNADERDGRSEATIFKRTPIGFQAVIDLAGGYEMKDFVGAL
jgi:hypothetical protein